MNEGMCIGIGICVINHGFALYKSLMHFLSDYRLQYIDFNMFIIYIIYISSTSIYLTNLFYRYRKKSLQMYKYKNKRLLCYMDISETISCFYVFPKYSRGRQKTVFMKNANSMVSTIPSLP